MVYRQTHPRIHGQIEMKAEIPSYLDLLEMIFETPPHAVPLSTENMNTSP